MKYSVIRGGCLLGLSLFLLHSTMAGAQNTDDVIRNLTGALGAQGRLMWVDGTANLTRTITTNGVKTVIDYSTTPEGVAAIVAHCKAAHINTIVVDVKPLAGEVLYKSAVAPRMRSWKGRAVPDFDVLAAFIAEGHKAGLQIDASINTLSEGHKYFSVGPAYAHPEWQSIVYTVDRGIVALDGGRLSVHVPNEPADPASPIVLNNDTVLLGSEPTSGLVGLESTDKANTVVTANVGSPLGVQVNLVLDANNRVAGIVDNALLGDDPLIAPEGGHLIPVTRDADRRWIDQHARAGTAVRFDIKTGFLPIAQAPSEKVACFVNPLIPEARRHELDIVHEIVSNYDIDGLVLDRCRYSNLNNDFSDRTRNAFARWLGRPISRWPQDVFSFAANPGAERSRGPLFKPWLEFRAEVIRQLVRDIAHTARSVKPKITLGTYVGSWYPQYYEVGVNWGSSKTALRYPWFTPNYPNTGYAEFFDWISTGCYYPTATREEARSEGVSEKGTVEFAADLSNQAVANGAYVYGGIFVPDYIGKPEELLRALNAAGRQSQGWMIFDISYVDDYGWWPVLERGFPKEATAPDLMPDVLAAVRSAADAAH